MTAEQPIPGNLPVLLTVRLPAYLALFWCGLAFTFALLEFLHALLVPMTGDIVWAGGMSYFLAPVTIAGIFLAAYARDRARSCHAVKLARNSLLAVMLGIITLLLFPATLFVSHAYRGGDSGSVSSLRTISTANVTYQATYGRGYAETLRALGPAPDGTCEKASADQSCLIDSVLVSGEKSGYRFTYSPGPKDHDGNIQSYSVHIDPIARSNTGLRSFYLDQTGVIRFEMDKVATADSPELK